MLRAWGWLPLVVSLMGCGGGGSSGPTLSLVASPVGQALASSDGKLLYLFDNDLVGQSVCNDDCADDWPPYTTTDSVDKLTAADGITATLSLFARADGHQQVLVNGYALYHFSGDQDAGDLRGQAILLDWFALSYAGQPLMSMSLAPTWSGADSGKTLSLGTTGKGKVLSDGKGRPLYTFMKDNSTTVACINDCAAVWPPLLSDSPTVTSDLDASRVGTMARPEGMQVTYAGKPVYTYVGDWNPGELRGLGIGMDWYALAADGTQIK